MSSASERRFSCPRRVRAERRAEPDFWSLDSCSFCRSLSPDRALVLLENGWPWMETGDRHEAMIGPHTVNLDHFGDGHRQRLVDRLNARRINIPGGVLMNPPFFCVPVG